MDIDALLMMGFGVFFTFLSFRKMGPFAKAAKLFRICGPALVVIGAVLVFAQTPAKWARQSTDDGFASAEFPGRPTRKEAVDTAGGVSLARVSYSYTLPGRDVTLVLSRSPLVGSDLTDEQRIEGAIAFFAQQGFEVTERQRAQCGDVQGYALKLHQKEKGATVLIRFAMAHANVYRVLVSFTSGNGAEIGRFMESFAVRRE
jgi:hypothetical protein